MADEEKKVFKSKDLKVSDLKQTHPLYDDNAEEWQFTMALYEGIREVIRLGLIRKHERESATAYARRMEELYGFGYTKSVIEIFNFYLFKKDADRQLGDLHDNKFWKLFMEDANLYGDDYDKTIMDIALRASILGHMGILVDKPKITFENKELQYINRVYPYIATYYPKAILDWSYERDQFDRPYLSYLKLYEDGDFYKLWFADHWELWREPTEEESKAQKNGLKDDEVDAVLVDSGANPIGVIPFIWHYNLKSKSIGIGNGDVHEVSRIDLSIIRNTSQAEEIIYLAAFPIMRKPKRDASPVTGLQPQGEDEVGVKAILEFDPQNPDSKSDWLDSSVGESIDAIIKYIEKKVAEVYRAANIGGMAATEPTANPQSGVAKRIDFQMLNSKMVNKAINLEDTENKINEMWLRWEMLWDAFKEVVKVTRDRTYDIEDLASDLDNALTARMVVQSKKFVAHLQKSIARQMLPNLSEKEQKEIDDEIDQSSENPVGSNFGNRVDNDFNKGDNKDKSIIEKGMNSGDNLRNQE